MRVVVDESKCQGHTLCAMARRQCSALRDDDGHSFVLVDEVPAEASGRPQGGGRLPGASDPHRRLSGDGTTLGARRGHPSGRTAGNWNESRYVDAWDDEQRIGAWLRIGMRPNEGRAEMSVCAYLPDGRVAFMFDRPGIEGNGLAAGGQEWHVGTPYRRNRVCYNGDLLLLDDPWSLTEPGRAYREARRVPASLDLVSTSLGLEAVMGRDQDHIDRIFLPGQADFHYQHLARTTGRIMVDGQTWEIDGRGGRDHSWGPRNWHAKIYLRWLICALDDGNGFMLMRAVGPTKATRGGHVLADGTFHLVDDFHMRNVYSDSPHYGLRSVEVDIQAGELRWSAQGTPQSWLPLRHRQPAADGREATLRIVKSPTDWRLD